MKRGRDAAFTLIELMVVIMIIALMAGVLFDVMSQARERARMTAPSGAERPARGTLAPRRIDRYGGPP